MVAPRNRSSDINRDAAEGDGAVISSCRTTVLGSVDAIRTVILAGCSCADARVTRPHEPKLRTDSSSCHCEERSDEESGPRQPHREPRSVTSFGMTTTTPLAVNRQILATNSLQGGLHRGRFLNHSSSHQTAFILRNDDFIGPRVADRVRVTLLSWPGNDFHVWIQRPGRDCDVQIVGIVVYHDADSPRAVNSRGLQDVVPFLISLNDHDFIFQELTVRAPPCFR